MSEVHTEDEFSSGDYLSLVVSDSFLKIARPYPLSVSNM